MGRKRLPPDEKKIKISIGIKKKYLDQLRLKHNNISQLIEKLVENYLKR